MSESHAARLFRSPFMAQVLKFGLVGGVGFVINLIVFNLLRTTVFEPSVLPHGPIYATIVAALVAITTTWIGNRYWAFSKQRSSNTAREGVEFFVVSLLGLLIPISCLWLSHYVLGYTSLLADNISSNAIGLVLGTIFRFALYRWWVFAPQRQRRSAGAGVEVTATATVPVDPEWAVDR